MPAVTRPGLFGPERPYGSFAGKTVVASAGPPGLVILYENRGLGNLISGVFTPAVWSATSSVATLPASNLANPVRGTVCRSAGLDAPWRLVVDFGGAVDLEALALVGSNLTTSATVVVKLNTADSWGSPAQTFLLVPWNQTTTGVLLTLFGASHVYRYMAIEITDATNPDGYYEVGVAYPSPVFELPISGPVFWEFAWEIVDPSHVSYARAQTPWTDDLAVYAQVEMSWRFISEALAFGEWQTMARAMGRKRDGVLCRYGGGAGATAQARSLNIYGRFPEIPRLVEVKTGDGFEYDWGPVTFRESL